MNDLPKDAAPSRVFLSYARGDDEPFVKRLHADLTGAGFTVWFDRESLMSRGLSFHQEIKDAIRTEVDRVVYVGGPKAAMSPYVREEWQFALECDHVVVTPILRLGDYENVPGELSLLHCEDLRDDAHYPAALAKLIASLRQPNPKLGALFAVPNLPPNFLGRPDLMRRVRDALLVDLQRPQVITGADTHVGMQGMGGIGKSVLAAALARNRQVRQAYPDGVIWIAAGQKLTDDDLLKRQRDLARHLGGDDAFASLAQGQGVLRQLLAAKAVLLVLDDVWRAADAQPFDVIGPRCRMLITTRDKGILDSLHGELVPVSLFTEPEALQLLAEAVDLATTALPAEAREVARECGLLPLALALCGGMARKRGGDFRSVLERLRRADLEKITDRESINEQHRSIWRAMQVSVEMLPDNEQQRFAELSVFATDQTVPEVAAATLWSHTGDLDDLDTEELLINLAERSLVQLDQKTEAGGKVHRRFRLHDLLHDYATRIAGEPRVVHQKLLDAYRKKCPAGWHTGPDDGYFFQTLCQHLAVATGNWDEGVALLCDLLFVEARCRVGQVFELIADYRLAQRSLPEAEADFRAEHAREDRVRRWTDEIIDYARQCAECHDRLAGVDGVAEPLPNPPAAVPTCKMRGEERPRVDCDRIIEKPTRRSWLEAFAHFVSGQCYPLLEHGRKPGFVRQHAYNSEPVGCVHDVAAPLTAAFPGPQLLRHWPSHAEPHPEPACLAVLYAHGDPVRAVALTSEGLLGISGGGISHDEQRISDNAIRIWDLGTSRCRYVLTGHGDRVTAIAATPDGRFMLSAGADRLLCYWDLVHGQMLWQKRTSSTVDTVALTPDGRFAAWGVDYYGGEVMIWDLRQDVLVNRLSGRELGASCLAITADLSRVLTAGGSYQRVNTALRLWDGRTGDCLQSWPAHSPFTKALAVTPLGDKAISSGADGQVAVWDARRGRGLQTFQAPGATCVALTADGTIGLAGCKDGTLRCWNLENGENLGVLEAHADVVSSLAVSPDGRFALSGSHDRTVRLWDLRRFNKHSPEKQIGELSALVLSDSDNAVAGGDDGRLWFFDTPGRLPRATIERHTGAVTDLAMAADQEQIVSVGDDNTCRVWDRRSGEMLALLECESSPVSLHLSPDARHALVATQFGDLTLLDLERRVQLGHFRAEQGLMGRTFPIALLGDGKHALCTSKASVVLWEIESGSILRRFEGHESRISVFLVTPDEKTLLSGSYDGTLRVWDVSTGRCLHVLAGHTACVRCLACDEEGIVAVTGGEDAAVRVWNLRDGKLVAVHVSQYGVISSLAFNPPAVYAGTKGGVLERLDINHAAQFSATRLARTGDAIRKARGAGRWPRALVSSVLVGIQNGVWKSPDANWVRGGLVQRRFCQECGFRISETPSKAPCPECKSVWVDRVFSAVSCPSCEAMAEDWFKYCPGCGRQRY